MGYLYRPLLKRDPLPNGQKRPPCPDENHGRSDTCSRCGARFARKWWVKYYVNGRAICESTGSEKESEARRFLKLREGAVAQGAPIPPRIDRIMYEELSQDLRQHYRTTGRRKLEEVEDRLRYLDRFFQYRRAASIGPALITSYVAERQGQPTRFGQPPGNRTLNVELALLKRMLRLAYENGKLLRVPPIKMLREGPPRQGFFEAEGFRALLRHLPADVQPVASFAYWTGWRKQEVLGLTWPQVDFKAGVVRLEPGTTKNREGRTFPLFPELRAVLEAQRTYTDRIQRERQAIIPWVFHRAGKPIKSFYRSWRTACRLAGQPGRIPHDFRRTAIRNMVRKGIPERVAMQLTGHKTRSVFDRYNIVSEGDLQEAGRKLTEAHGHILGHSGRVSLEKPTPNM